jgi:hypothetical protein
VDVQERRRPEGQPTVMEKEEDMQMSISFEEEA